MMKKSLLRAAAVMLAAVVVISSLGLVVAQENADEVQPQLLVPVLAVAVSNVTHVAEPMTMTVMDRGNGAAVEGASVYALSWPRMGTLDVDSLIPPKAYHCEFLGKSKGDGEVVYTFKRPGGFLIVATKEGYGPGLARLVVKPNLMCRLEIKASGRAVVHQPVAMKVVERGSGEGVSEADVWAISVPMRVSASGKIPPTDDVRALLEGLKDVGGGNMTGVLSKHGFHLGQTGNDGGLEYTFSEAGRYLLVSIKGRYVPGIKPIAIVAGKALAIKAPRRAAVGDEVTFTAVVRGTGSPVEGVALYALRWPFTGFLRMPFADTGAEGNSLKDLAIGNGDYLGTTDDKGEFKYQFSEAGRHLIVGVADGYVPGITFISSGQFGGVRELWPQLKRFGERLRERLGE